MTDDDLQATIDACNAHVIALSDGLILRRDVHSDSVSIRRRVGLRDDGEEEE